VNRIIYPFLLIFFITVLALAAGCVFSSEDNRRAGETEGTINQALPSEYPFSNPVSVYITYPDFDGGVDAGDVTVIVLVRNFSVVNRIGEKNRPGEGHLVYFKDVTPPTTPGTMAITRPGTYQISSQTRCTWYNVSPGTHTFAVELVNNDNTPLVPAVIDAVDVTAVSYP